MNSTSHSEYMTLDHLFVKSAEQAFVSQELIDEQWERLNYLSRPDFNEAVKEYRSFLALLEGFCERIDRFPEAGGLSADSIYCRDASIVTDFGVILCNMGKADRKAEPEAQGRSFLEKGMEILGQIQSPGTLEGGDVAWLDQNTLAVGHGYRTNKEGIRQLKAILEPRGVEVIVAELPHYKGPGDVFHLMSILSPVDEKLAVVYSPLMPVAFREELLARGYELIEVPEEEFESMGCNVLAVAPKTCVMVEGNPITENSLREKGCRVLSYKGKHISVLGGGGPTCLTRPLKRVC